MTTQNQNQYGTTIGMVIQTIENNGMTQIIAIDSDGLYLTTPNKVDSKLADVNRYGVNREYFISALTSMGYDPVDLFEKNKHLINIEQGAGNSSKKLNPIKASKRGF